jgi:hypothetical protein
MGAEDWDKPRPYLCALCASAVKLVGGAQRTKYFVMKS